MWGILHGPSPALLKHYLPNLLMMLGIINANRLPNAYWAGVSAKPPSSLRAERRKEADSGGDSKWAFVEALTQEWEINTSRRQTNCGVSWQTLTDSFILVVRFCTSGGYKIG